MKRFRRVYQALANPQRGERVELEPAEAHHLRRVLRLRVGDPAALFNGAGAEWAATVVELSESCVALRIAEPIETPVEAPLKVTLYQALERSERVDWVVQKGTEIGLSAIRLIGSERVGRGAVPEKRLERWRKIAAEACKQCGRRSIPALDALPRLPAAGRGALALLLDPDEETPALGLALQTAAVSAVELAVGPEGGFSDAETRAATAAGWTRASLGPRTLRSETAGIVAAALVLHRWGDLGPGAG